jgi:hypothetical protein
LEMVIYVQQGGTRRRRFNIYKWVELVVDWEFAWSLQQQVLGGVCRWLFPSKPSRFGDGAPLWSSVRQAV